MCSPKLVMAFVVAAAWLAPGQDPAAATAELRERVAGLVADLDGDDFAEREHATRALIDLGPPARTLIEEAMEKAPVEVRMRLRQILLEMPQSLQKAADPLETNPLTVTFEDAPATRVLTWLEKHGGATFRQPTNIAADELVTLEAKEAPFFDVLDKFCKEIGRGWYRDFNDGAFRFTAGATGGQPLVSYSGPFRISLRAITHNSTLTFGAAAVQNCYVHGQVDVDPAATVTGVWMPPKIEEIVDEQGRDLTAKKAVQTPNLTANRKVFHFTANLAPPPADSKKVARFAGKFRVLVPETWRQATVEAPGEGEPPKEVVGEELTVRFVSTAQRGNTTNVTVEIERPPLLSNPNVRNPVFDQTFIAVTADGEIHRPTRRPGRRLVRGVETFTVFFDGKLDVRAMRVKSLAAVEEREIAFEFKDLPLP